MNKSKSISRATAQAMIKNDGYKLLFSNIFEKISAEGVGDGAKDSETEGLGKTFGEFFVERKPFSQFYF